MAQHISFEAIKMYLHKNIYPLCTMRDKKNKKSNFPKECKPFSMLDEQWKAGYLFHRTTQNNQLCS